MFRAVCLSCLLLAFAILPLASGPTHANCGEVIRLETRGAESITYGYGATEAALSRAALVLLAGDTGYLNLDDEGCARKLKGNTRVRNQKSLRQVGFATAVVDAPSDRQGKDGLGGFRIEEDHAKDLSLVIADLQKRTGLQVYVIGSSRGTISAANAASCLSSQNAANATMLMSLLTLGRDGAFKPWVAHSVFDLPLANITKPLSVVVHVDDKCPRTPSGLGEKIVKKSTATHATILALKGGPENSMRARGLKACAGKTPHGFVGQDEYVVRIISEFVAAQK